MDFVVHDHLEKEKQKPVTLSYKTLFCLLNCYWRLL